MRQTQPARLKLRAARSGNRSKATWVIKDREHEISTGFGESEREEAERALAEYVVQKRQPAFGNGDPLKS
jgi:hypothetical protein